MAHNKRKGWKSESARHSLARKGIKTGRKKSYNFPIKWTRYGEAIIKANTKKEALKRLEERDFDDFEQAEEEIKEMG